MIVGIPAFYSVGTVSILGPENHVLMGFLSFP
jgi:hypothetical protein